MKTSADMLDRMEALIRSIATAGDESSTVYLNELAEDWENEARAIVSELPEQIDADIKTAREHCALVANECMNSLNADAYMRGEYDETQEMITLVAALRRAREEGVR